MTQESHSLLNFYAILCSQAICFIYCLKKLIGLKQNIRKFAFKCSSPSDVFLIKLDSTKDFTASLKETNKQTAFRI